MSVQSIGTEETILQRSGQPTCCQVTCQPMGYQFKQVRCVVQISEEQTVCWQTVCCDLILETSDAKNTIVSLQMLCVYSYGFSLANET